MRDKIKEKIKIRRARESDVEAFYPFFEKSMKTQFPHSKLVAMYHLEENYPKEFLKNSIKNKTKFLYIAYEEGEIAGYLIANKNSGGMAFVNWLAVFSKFQKKGFASSLLSEYEKDVLKNGGYKVYLWTIKGNIDFYRNRGFILAGAIPDAWFGQEVHYLFYKTLRKSDPKKFLKEFIEKKKKS